MEYGTTTWYCSPGISPGIWYERCGRSFPVAATIRADPEKKPVTTEVGVNGRSGPGSGYVASVHGETLEAKEVDRRFPAAGGDVSVFPDTGIVAPAAAKE